MNSICRILALLGLVVFSRPAWPAVEYCPATDTIRVADYPADFPCTPRMLARIDRTFGWGRVHADADGKTIIVAANLVIGWNDGSSTFFQIGDAACPDEILVVQGEVRVYPNWLAGENPDPVAGQPFQSWMLRRTGLVNRLQLGAADNPAIHGALLLEKHARGPCRLVIGGFHGVSSKNAGGQLLVYNSLISSRGDDPIEAAYMGGIDRLELIGATVRGFQGVFGRMLGSGKYLNSRFEKCGAAVTGTYQTEVRGCALQDCGTAVSVTRDGVLYDCRFSGNRLNWALNHKGRLVAVDCDVDDWGRGTYSTNPSAYFISKRHVIVKAADRAGRPLPGAVVKLIPPAAMPAGEFDKYQAITGAAGRTPGPGETGALILTDLHLAAGRDGRPERTDYRCTIRVSHGHRTAELKDIAPRASWDEFELVLPD